MEKTIVAPRKSWLCGVVIVILLLLSAGLFYYSYLGWQALTATTSSQPSPWQGEGVK